jgi:hypothetical protein
MYFGDTLQGSSSDCKFVTLTAIDACDEFVTSTTSEPASTTDEASSTTEEPTTTTEEGTSATTTAEATTTTAAGPLCVDGQRKSFDLGVYTLECNAAFTYSVGGNLIKSVLDQPDVESCARQCDQTGGCRFFNYYTSYTPAGQCDLLLNDSIGKSFVDGFIRGKKDEPTPSTTTAAATTTTVAAVVPTPECGKILLRSKTDGSYLMNSNAGSTVVKADPIDRATQYSLVDHQVSDGSNSWYIDLGGGFSFVKAQTQQGSDGPLNCAVDGDGHLSCDATLQFCPTINYLRGYLLAYDGMIDSECIEHVFEVVAGTCGPDQTTTVTPAATTSSAPTETTTPATCEAPSLEGFEAHCDASVQGDSSKNEVLSARNVEECAYLCAMDDVCLAFTYVEGGAQNCVTWQDFVSFVTPSVGVTSGMKIKSQQPLCTDSVTNSYGFDVQCETLVIGPNPSDVGTSGLQECIYECQSNLNCVAFNYYGEGVCLLYASVTGVEKSSFGTSSGQKPTASPTTTTSAPAETTTASCAEMNGVTDSLSFDIRCDSILHPDTSGASKITASTLDICLKECHNDDECVAFWWVEAQQSYNCAIFKTLFDGEYEPYAGVISGQKPKTTLTATEQASTRQKR